MRVIGTLGMLALLVVIAALAINCDSSDEEPNGGPLQTEPDLTGVIASAQPIGANGVAGTILVEARVAGNAERVDKYVVTVKDETPVFEQQGDDFERISFGELAVGQQARVWFDGPVRESYPLQADALQVIVVKSITQEISLGEEFSLAVGRSASITGEDLEIKFRQVVGDSRCATGVTCVWEGEVTVSIDITDAGTTQMMTLTQPGLTDEYSTKTYREYTLTFKVQPYPEADVQISIADYLVLLTISR
jgi:hypothetical protein